MMLQQHTILGHVTLIEHISDNELRITNGGYDSDEADIIDILPPYPSKVPSKITTRDEFLKLVSIDNSELSVDNTAHLHNILHRK